MPVTEQARPSAAIQLDAKTTDSPIVLPVFDRVAERASQGQPLNPLERFILDHAPNGDIEGTPFGNQLLVLLTWAQGQPAAKCRVQDSAQAHDADALNRLSRVHQLAESTLQACGDAPSLRHTLTTITAISSSVKRPECSICNNKGFIAFDDSAARLRYGNRWGACKCRLDARAPAPASTPSGHE